MSFIELYSLYEKFMNTSELLHEEVSYSIISYAKHS
jgi:hypothetical protein